MPQPRQNVPNIVREYASLYIRAHREQLTRGMVSPALVRRIQEIESWGETRLTPEQQEQALLYAQREWNSLIAEESRNLQINGERLIRQNERLRQANEDTLARRVGDKAGIDVRNAEEFHRVLRGKSLKRGTPKPTRVAPQTLDAATKYATKHLDANGEGFTAKEWRDKLDDLWEYHGTQMWKDKVRAAGLRYPKALSDAMVRFQKEEIVGHLSPPAHEADPLHEVETSERDLRRAFIAKEIAKGIAKDGTDREVDELHRHEVYNQARDIVEDKYGYENGSLRQDIAKATLEHWPEDSKPEIEYDYSDDPTFAEGDEDEED